MNRAQRRRAERRGENFWNKVLTGREVAGMLESYDQAAVAPLRYVVDTIVMWRALPWWKRAWLRLRGEDPFKGIPSLVEQAQSIGREGRDDAGAPG